MEKKWFTFGHIPAIHLVTLLFYTGLIPIVYKAIAFGKSTSLQHTIMKTVPDGRGMYTGIEVPNASLGILYGLLAFAIGVVVWKVVCEILLIVLRYFERARNVDKHGPEL